MKNVITLGKLICLLLSSLPLVVLLSINVYTKNTRNELVYLVMGTIFLVYNILNLSFVCAKIDDLIIVCFPSSQSNFQYISYMFYI